MYSYCKCENMAVTVNYFQPYVPSFLSMDTDGRVVRFDSFSKLVSSG